MPNPVKLFEENRSHLSNEEKAQREDAKKELMSYKQLSDVAPPSYMPASGKTLWNKLIPSLIKDYPITDTDLGMLESYCIAYARLVGAEREITKYGVYQTDDNGNKKVNPAVKVQSQAIKDLKACASALGITLEARTRLALNRAKETKEKDPFESLMSNE